MPFPSFLEMSSNIWSGTTNDAVNNLAYDSKAHTLASKYGLNISTVAWEDTGRTKGSCWGPNISDMTLCTASGSTNMPIIRKPNYSDLTSDQDISSFSVNVGNENGSDLKQISLHEYLLNITKYTDIKLTQGGSLIAIRDTHILTYAQACVLPLKDGKVEFAVKLYNYQSRTTPAVLVIIVSSQGTSAHYVLGRDNTLDFNKNGLKAKFLAERLRDDRAKRGVPLDGPMTDDEKIRNALMIFQIPLKYTAPTAGVWEQCSSLADSSYKASSYKGKSYAQSCGFEATSYALTWFCSYYYWNTWFIIYTWNIHALHKSM